MSEEAIEVIIEALKKIKGVERQLQELLRKEART
jgi:hypothetical protein